jgi:chloramphenicol-sensitive protein RarD
VIETSAAQAAASTRRGYLYAVSAYGLWGLLPLYFLALAPTSPFEVVPWRILLSLVFCALLITVTRRWRDFVAIVRQPRLVGTMALAGVLIYINWQVFLYGALTGHVVETSLGYFINPIVTVFLGVFFLRERLRPAQWVAVGISLIAVAVLAIGYGSLPWIALVLASSFALYGLIKKTVGNRIDAVTGLTLETAWLTPVAVVQLFVVAGIGGITFGSVSTAHTVLLLAAGVITAVPLLLFAGAASRLPLIALGFVQFLAPVMQFLVGVFVAHEPMPPERLAGFALVWCALVVLSADGLIAGRRGRIQPVEPI